MEFGDKFKNARTDKGYTLKQIEEDTKIRVLYLEALENDNFKMLLPRVYAVGFVRRYAKYLGLNENELAEEFKQRAYPDQDEELPPKPEPARGGLNLSIPNILGAILFLVIAIGVGSFLLDYMSAGIDDKEKNSMPGIVTQSSEKEQNNGQEDTVPPVIPAPDKPAGGTLVIKANSDCWLHAKVDGVTVFEAILPGGQEKILQGQELIYIKVGNAGGIELAYNGEKLAPLAEGPEVMEKEFTIRDDNDDNE